LHFTPLILKLTEMGLPFTECDLGYGLGST